MSNEVFSRLTRNEDMQPLLRQIGSLMRFVLVSVSKAAIFFQRVFTVSGISYKPVRYVVYGAQETAKVRKNAGFSRENIVLFYIPCMTLPQEIIFNLGEFTQ